MKKLKRKEKWGNDNFYCKMEKSQTSSKETFKDVSTF